MIATRAFRATLTTCHFGKQVWTVTKAILSGWMRAAHERGMFMPSLPRSLVFLGLAGIAPQVLCVAKAFAVPDDRWFALAAGCCYAAVILSFLGGLWWMAGLLSGRTGEGFYALAVAPSLIAWAALLPWCFGWSWPGPSLLVLGGSLLASPLVDRQLARTMTLPADWLRLRMVLAGGLGLSTMALAMV